MSPVPLVAGLAGMAAGAALLVVARRSRPRPAVAAGEYLRGVGLGAIPDARAELLAEHPLRRLVAPLAARCRRASSRLFPPARIAALDRQIALAGKTATMSGEEAAAAQFMLTLASAGLALAWVGVTHPSAGMRLLVVVLLPFCGIAALPAWLSRRARTRQDRIRATLPDVLDLLAISVEAGLGLEAAIQVAGTHFTGPLAEELSRTLQEISLGRSRREALQALRRRTDVPELSTFIVALTQADALGIPIGRVLHVQAAELRARRRQWARERAAKLPVKILFPLISFIFPPLLVVLLGPAAMSIARAFR